MGLHQWLEAGWRPSQFEWRLGAASKNDGSAGHSCGAGGRPDSREHYSNLRLLTLVGLERLEVRSTRLWQVALMGRVPQRQSGVWPNDNRFNVGRRRWTINRDGGGWSKE